MGGSLPSPLAPNPSLLLIDADALLQFLIAGEMRQFRAIKQSFDIQPAIVEAVEMEIRKSKKFRAKFTKDLQKAIDSETLLVLDTRSLWRFVEVDANTIYDALQTRGFQYARVLDYGEAYTFAAAVVLRAPVISNDINAIRAAARAKLDLPTYLFRAFDVLILCNHSGLMSDSECDATRKSLIAANEWVPASFQHASFCDGLNRFYPRMLVLAKTPVGVEEPQNDLDVRIFVKPKA